MLRRLIRFNIMFIVSAFTTPTIAFEDCGQIYKKTQNHCSVQNNLERQKDKNKIEKSTDAAADVMKLGLSQVVTTAYTMCGQSLVSCRTLCQRNPKELADCKETGVYGLEYAKMKGLVTGAEQMIIAGGGETKSSTAPKFKAGLGLPSDLGRPGFDSSPTSHDTLLDDQKTKAQGVNIGVQIPLGGKATAR